MEVVKVHTVPREPESITLKVTREEAKALLAVCQKIGGDPEHSGRRHIDSLHECLYKAGFRQSEEPLRGEMHFGK